MRAYLLGLALLAQPAIAAPLAQASFAAGTPVPYKIVISETIWTCADGRCTGPADARAVAMQRACNALARQVGEVASLTVGASALTPEAVQACNAKAGRSPKAVAAK